jgi:hypothetical protein
MAVHFTKISYMEVSNIKNTVWSSFLLPWKLIREFDIKKFVANWEETIKETKEKGATW